MSTEEKVWIGYCDLCNGQHCLQLRKEEAGELERRQHWRPSAAPVADDYRRGQELMRQRVAEVLMASNPVLAELVRTLPILGDEPQNDTFAAAREATREKRAAAIEGEDELAAYHIRRVNVSVPAPVADEIGSLREKCHALEKALRDAKSSGRLRCDCLPNIPEHDIVCPWIAIDAALAGAKGEPAPLQMVLHCPVCHEQHIDALELRPRWLNSVGTPEGYLSDAEWEAQLGRNPWLNPPHKSHLCHGCGTIWRPADVPTNGVASVSRGKADTWPVGADEKPLPSSPPNEKTGPEFSPVADEAEALLKRLDGMWPDAIVRAATLRAALAAARADGEKRGMERGFAVAVEHVQINADHDGWALDWRKARAALVSAEQPEKTK